jgi:hypothetical protein
LLVYQEEKANVQDHSKFLQLYHLMSELVNENNNLSSIQSAN